jgi:hypothetical protein
VRWLSEPSEIDMQYFGYVMKIICGNKLIIEYLSVPSE